MKIEVVQRYALFFIAVEWNGTERATRDAIKCKWNGTNTISGTNRMWPATKRLYNSICARILCDG